MQVVINNFVFIENATVELDEGFTVVKGENLTSSGNTSNGSGKTLFLEAIAWCVWGQSIRGAAQESLVGPASKNMSVSIDKNGFKITRSRSGAKVTVVVEKDGEEISFQKAAQAQDYINEEFGMNWTKAQLLVYSGESSRHPLDMTPSQRRDAIVSLMEYPEDTHNEIAERLSDMVRNTATMKARNDGKMEVARTKHSERTNALQKSFDDLSDAIDRSSAEVARLSSVSSNTVSDEEIEKIKASIISNDSFVSGLEGQMNNYRSAIRNYEQMISERTLSIERINNLEITAAREVEDEFRKRSSDVDDVFYGRVVVPEGHELSRLMELVRLDKEHREECEATKVAHNEWTNRKISREANISSLRKDVEKCAQAVRRLENDRLTLKAQYDEAISERSRISSSTTSDHCYACRQEIVSEDARVSLKGMLEEADKRVLDIEDKMSKNSLDTMKATVDLEDTEEQLSLDMLAFNDFLSTEPKVIIYEFSSSPVKTELHFCYKNLIPKPHELDIAKKERILSLGLASEKTVCSDLIQSYKNKISEEEECIRRNEREIVSLKADIRGLNERLQAAYDTIKQSEVNQQAIILEETRLADLKKQLDYFCLEDKLSVVDGELEVAAHEYAKEEGRIELYKAISENIKKKLSAYKHYTVTRFVQTFEEKINQFLKSLSSDIRCKVVDDGGEIEFLFTDSSKGGEYYAYKLASRGERTRIKKVFFQVLIEMFAPPFILSDESYDGLDTQGSSSLSEFTAINNQNRCFIEATPLDIDFGDVSYNLVTCRKTDNMIRIIQ